MCIRYMSRFDMKDEINPVIITQTRADQWAREPLSGHALALVGSSSGWGLPTRASLGLTEKTKIDLKKIENEIQSHFKVWQQEALNVIADD